VITASGLVKKRAGSVGFGGRGRPKNGALARGKTAANAAIDQAR